jgi:carbonic anhydrase
VVCGHCDCGAMKGLRNLEKLAELPAVLNWLAHAESARRTVQTQFADLDEESQIRILTEENVLCQLSNLRTHPAVAAALAAGKLNLYAWVYYIESGRIDAFDPEQGRFVPIGASAEVPEASPRLRRRVEAVA